jgi:hypothetical protein
MIVTAASEAKALIFSRQNIRLQLQPPMDTLLE